MIPYPTWLSSGDNAWQMTAATLVGLMSIPALAVLYGGLVQKKWAMNTTLMVFVTFCLVLITWVLWAYKMGFGTPLIRVGTTGLWGDPRTILGANALEGQASIPLVDPAMPGYLASKSGEILNSGFRLPGASIEYFQFVFAAITPILFIGSVLGRVSFKAWMVFVRSGLPSLTRSTPSSSGAAATGRTTVRSTSPVVTSSTWRLASPASSPPP